MVLNIKCLITIDHIHLHSEREVCKNFGVISWAEAVGTHQEPPPKGHLQGLGVTQLLGKCLGRPPKTPGRGLLGADWLNLQHNVTWNPAEEER